ncbi:MAG: ferrous iron transport protein A [Candidatus Latescibacteria bacterium]|nr:ferrous iron transport protein A [Candidatus Latescibacterota bacterium]MCK5525927.1 ferrous iron transport protein A [Candidatus Latescibacterota bacterium]
MAENGRILLTAMETGQLGKVVQIQGGRGMIGRLEVLGIRIGRELRKVSSQFMRGPVVLEVGNTQVAVGFGMAGKIWVEVAE